MKFGFEQRWTATVHEVVDVYTDESFWASLPPFRTTAPPEILEVRRERTSAFTRLRYRLNVELPKEAARFIDPDDVSWVEESTWDLSAATAGVRFLPDQGASLMRADASVEVVADGDDAVRRVRGELKVRIPLLGGKVERAVVGNIGEHLEEEADAVATRLEG